MLDRAMNTPMDSHTKKAVQFLDAAFHYLLKHCRLQYYKKKYRPRFLTALKLLTNMLTYFKQLISLYTPRKHQKAGSFLIFSGGIESGQWEKWIN